MYECGIHFSTCVQTLLPRGGPESPLRERNTSVNNMLTEYVKGNSRVQLVNIDTGFVQVNIIHPVADCAGVFCEIFSRQHQIFL